LLGFAIRVYANRMLGFFVRTAWRMLVLAFLVYGTFFVPIGERTLYGHGRRIASTAEAQELWSSVANLARDAHHSLAR
jgi:hypothetical protein